MLLIRKLKCNKGSIFFLIQYFYVEYFCNGKPSGIATTKADIYYIYLDKLYIIKTEVLKDKCRKYINTNRDKKGGDNMASKGIILPLNELL